MQFESLFAKSPCELRSRIHGYSKMASVEAVIGNCSRHSERISCINEEKLWANCLTMKDYVQVLTTELKSAQLIIKILQVEL